MTEQDGEATIKRHLFKVGHIAALWAKFEYELNLMIWHLGNVDIEVGACLTAQVLSPSNRMNALIALVRLRGGNQDLLSAFNKFYADADALARRRNRVVHDPWILAQGQMHRFEVSAYKTLVFDLLPAPTEEIDAVADAIIKIDARLAGLYDRVVGELPPWPDTEFQRSLDKHPLKTISVPDIET